MPSMSITETSSIGCAIVVRHDDGAKVTFAFAEGLVETNIIGAEGDVVATGRLEVDYRSTSMADPFFEVVSLGDTRVVLGLASGGTIEAVATEDGIYVNAYDADEDLTIEIGATHGELGSAEPVPVIGR